MFRGTTPKLEFIFDYNFEDLNIEEFYITIKQGSKLISEKSLKDITISKNKAIISLTQSETLSMKETYNVLMQARLKVNGEAYATDIVSVGVASILKDGTIPGGSVDPDNPDNPGCDCGTIDYNDLENKPTKLSDFINDGVFITNTVNDLTDYYNKTEINKLLSSKVNTSDLATETTNGLMSSDDKVKLNGIASGANVNVQSDWNQTDTSTDDFIKNKPTIPTQLSDLSGTLPISQGGTGGTTESSARSNLGVSGTVLYSNSSGSSGTITLSSTVDDFMRIGIHVKRMGDKIGGYNEVFKPYATGISISTIDASNSTYECTIWLSCLIALSGTTLTFSRNFASSYDKTDGYKSNSADGFKIVRVVGYNY